MAQQTPTPADLASYLHQAAIVLGEHAVRVEAATSRVRSTGRVGVEDFAALAEAEGVRLRTPASALLMAAEILSSVPPPSPTVGLLPRYLVMLAQVLRREADALLPVRRRAEGDTVIIVEAVRASLLEQASMCLMLASFLDDQ